MSVKEEKRRKMSSLVMLEAWRLNHRTLLYVYTFGTSLKLAWQIVRGKLKRYYTKLAGVMYNGRQSLINRLSRYPEHQIIIKLIREPLNPFDESAICVIAHVRGKGSACIGYLNRSISSTLAPLMDSGRQVIVDQFNITGGTDDKAFGFNIGYLIA